MATKILTASQMREIDRLSTEKLGIPSIVLMENAGRSVAELIIEKFSEKFSEKFPQLDKDRLTILCGKGNNGGDGFVVARHLLMRGWRPRVVLLADPEDLKGDARKNCSILLQSGYEAQPLPILIGTWPSSRPILPNLYALGAGTTAVTLFLIFTVLVAVTLRLRFRGAPVQRVAEELGETDGLSGSGLGTRAG